VGQDEGRFGPFGDSVNLDAIHYLHGTCNWLKNHFGATDGTPRGNGLSESSFWSIRR
jgi:hypothetical protein